MPLQIPGPLVKTDWLASHLDGSDLIVLDGSFTMPSVQPEARGLEDETPVETGLASDGEAKA
ncbi:hypothetical protein GGQ64_002872 [Rhizobium azooxidifex]|uniref:Sulfurtransferase n=1 Tax=Mycoplana azooxidifex TaxID=1636188 RepID=A0A7W6DAF1_9HYPH|nr:hypothetical protein [Mycoplana azooxidifex]MBB3977666.1 hypothetical protein [Mycoplana azooxidifex]